MCSITSDIGQVKIIAAAVTVAEGTLGRARAVSICLSFFRGGWRRPNGRRYRPWGLHGQRRRKFTAVVVAADIITITATVVAAVIEAPRGRVLLTLTGCPMGREGG